MSQDPLPGDDELVQRLRARIDEPKWCVGQLADAFGDVVFAILRWRGVNENDLEDLWQDTFMAAQEGWPPELRSKGELGAWLLTIAKNQVSHRWRHDNAQKRNPGKVESVHDVDPTASPEDDPAARLQREEEIEEERRKKLEKYRVASLMIAKLTSAQAEALLDQLRGLSVEESAKRKGTTTGNIHTMRSRGRRELLPPDEEATA